MKKMVIIILSILFLSACMTPPQTREEYIGYASKEMGMLKMRTHIINRPFMNVVKDLEKKSEKCLHVQVDSSVPGDFGPERARNIYVPSVVVVEDGKAEFTLRVITAPKVLGEPEGGMYISAADIYKVSKSQTKVIVYGFDISYHGEVMDAIKIWCEGKDTNCPHLQ
jgi:hypothetical protein